MNRKLRILMAADVPPNPDSGAAGVEFQTMKALREMGHEVESIWADDMRRRIRHGNLHYLLELPWTYRDAIRNRANNTSFDVIHVNQPYAWLAACDHQRQQRKGIFVTRTQGWEPRVAEALRPWRRKYGVPEWHWPRGIVGRPVQWWLHRVYPRWCAEASDGFIASCGEDRDYIIQKYNVPADRVVRIPTAPASVFFESDPLTMSAKRRRRILCVGQTAFFKGPHVVAGVFSRLAEMHPDLLFTWCCPEESHQAWRSRLNPAAQARTTFVGWMKQDQLVRLYDDHGMFLFTTFAEGFGNVFLEAMARGLCVVASNVVGMRDIIRNGETGFLLEPGDVDGFVQKVEQIRTDPARAACMAQAAAVEARRYSWKRVASEATTFYLKLIKNKLDAV